MVSRWEAARGGRQLLLPLCEDRGLAHRPGGPGRCYGMINPGQRAGETGRIAPG